ncbi:MAG: hypothetical protein ACMXYB_00990 [Candidatus Woesearchaeota archaeon]
MNLKKKISNANYNYELVTFEEFSKLCLILKAHSKKLIKIQILSDFLMSFDPSDVTLMIDIMSGNFAREISKKEFSISLKTVFEALSSYYMVSRMIIEKEFNSTGDIYKTLENLDVNFKNRSIFQEKSFLMLEDFSQILIEISQISGKNSNLYRKNKILQLLSLTNSLEERKVLVAYLADLLKIGANEGIIHDAFVFAFFPKLSSIHYFEDSLQRFIINIDILEEYKKVIQSERLYVKINHFFSSHVYNYLDYNKSDFETAIRSGDVKISRDFKNVNCKSLKSVKNQKGSVCEKLGYKFELIDREKLIGSIFNKLYRFNQSEISISQNHSSNLLTFFPYINIVIISNDNLESQNNALSVQEFQKEIFKGFKDLFDSLYSYNVSYKVSYDKLKEDIINLFNPPIIFGKPIKVMLGPRLYSFDEINSKVEFPFFCDYKYDGLRLIIQNDFGDVKLFSRNLEDLTSQFKEIVYFIETNFSNTSCVFDAECVGFEKSNFKQVKFQELSKRIMTKSHNLKSNIIIGMRIFDILELNGEFLHLSSLEKRQGVLRKLFTNTSIIIDKKRYSKNVVEELENFFK